MKSGSELSTVLEAQPMGAEDSGSETPSRSEKFASKSIKRTSPVQVPCWRLRTTAVLPTQLVGLFYCYAATTHAHADCPRSHMPQVQQDQRPPASGARRCS
jgi:hypothetical protein